jgi:hypothetical protein
MLGGAPIATAVIAPDGRVLYANAKIAAPAKCATRRCT